MTGRQGRRPNLLVVAITVALAATAISCTDSSGSGTSPGATALTELSSNTTGSSPIALGASQRSVDVGATFDWGAFRLTIGHAVFDRDLQAVGIGVRVHNTATIWQQTTWSGAEVRSGGKGTVLFGPVVDLPPGAIAEVTLNAQLVTGDPLDGGSFHLGSATQPSVDVPLVARGDAPANPELFLATPVAIDGWASIGKYTVHATSGLLLSSSPDLVAEPVGNERVLRITYDLFAIRQDPVNGFGPGEHLKLRRPDGKTVDALIGSKAPFPVSWSAFAGNTVDFAVPADAAGEYSLSISSISPISLVPHPERIERVEMPFTAVIGAPVAPAPTPSAIPDLTVLRDPTKSSAPPSGSPSAPVDLALDVTGNPTGFLVHVSRLKRAAGSNDVRVEAKVNSLTRRPTGEDKSPGKAGGLFDVDPQFSPTVALITRGQVVPGTIDATEFGIPPDGRTLAFKFTPSVATGAPAPDLSDATLVIGNRSDRPAFIPLGSTSPMPLDPIPPSAEGVPIDALPIVSGDWSVDVLASRTGLFSGSVAQGKVQLEVDLEVTAASNAAVKSLGLTFRPEAQVFLARPDGYLKQAVKTNSLQFFEPGQTFRMQVVFELDSGVLDRRGSVGSDGVVIRSRDESGEIPEAFVETKAAVNLL